MRFIARVTESKERITDFVGASLVTAMGTSKTKGKSASGRKGTRRSEKAKVSEEALLTRSSKATKPMNA